MSRYIDADALIEEMHGSFVDSVEERTAIEIVNDAPSIDIVRCKECKYCRYQNADDAYICKKTGHSMYTTEHFCSYGERRE